MHGDDGNPTSGVENDPDIPARDVQPGGESVGVPNRGRDEGHSQQSTGGQGLRRWQDGYISRAEIDKRGNLFRAAIEMTRMPMVVTDARKPDNPIVFTNPALLDLCGYAEDEVIGQNCRFLQGPGTDRGVVREMRDAIEAQRSTAVEILNYKKDRTPFWNALFIGPIFDEARHLLYWFSSHLDVTSRRASDEALRQAQKMEAIGQLAASVAHDLNNLLTVIVGNAEIAAGRAQAGEDAVLRKALDGIGQTAQRGERLVGQLLAVARKQPLEPKSVDLNALVVSFGDLLASTLGSQVDLRLELTPRLPTCTVDPVQLELALRNVIINARDASSNGSQVTVATDIRRSGEARPQQSADATDFVVLSVVDNGAGMPADVQSRATEPFFTTKEKGKGTGLGLAMVHGFMQQSGGRLEIESQPGRGTTVRLMLPATPEGVEIPPRDGADPPQRAHSPRRGQRRGARGS